MAKDLEEEKKEEKEGEEKKEEKEEIPSDDVPAFSLWLKKELEPVINKV